MIYDWENRVPRQPVNEAQRALAAHGFALIGVAVQNPDTGEAAFIQHRDFNAHGLELADALMDVKGDVDRAYRLAVDKAFEA